MFAPTNAKFCLQDNKGTESEHINLKVLGQDNAVVQFKIKKHTPLRKLMNAYCDRAVSFNQKINFNSWAIPLTTFIVLPLQPGPINASGAIPF